MSTVRRSRRKRKHHPELLRAKRAARALNLAWADVVRERDRLRTNEIDSRGHLDEARKAAWHFWLARMGWASTHDPYWRSGFRRVFGKRLENGADYKCVRFYDEVARAAQTAAPEFTDWSLDDIWDFLFSEYPERRPVWEHYQQALCRLAAAQLPAGDSLADDSIISDLETPF